MNTNKDSNKDLAQAAEAMRMPQSVPQSAEQAFQAHFQAGAARLATFTQAMNANKSLESLTESKETLALLVKVTELCEDSLAIVHDIMRPRAGVDAQTLALQTLSLQTLAIQTLAIINSMPPEEQARRDEYTKRILAKHKAEHPESK